MRTPYVFDEDENSGAVPVARHICWTRVSRRGDGSDTERDTPCAYPPRPQLSPRPTAARSLLTSCGIGPPDAPARPDSQTAAVAMPRRRTRRSSLLGKLFFICTVLFVFSAVSYFDRDGAEKNLAGPEHPFSDGRQPFLHRLLLSMPTNRSGGNDSECTPLSTCLSLLTDLRMRRL
ncbi:Hypp2407 [Branchiostoma lanceolatum]|uniref:Hypp2407 protein n=1 Tax=Branchiostoma lanceolatum TaxID=7740 RepID=A0A8J9ZQE3_BRALA|nr:Hypp2407 [Branchiostoma lanceolatum]